MAIPVIELAPIVSSIPALLNLKIFLVGVHVWIRVVCIDECFEVVRKVEIEYCCQVSLSVAEWVDCQEVVRVRVAVRLKRIMIRKETPTDVVLVKQALGLACLSTTPGKDQTDRFQDRAVFSQHCLVTGDSVHFSELLVQLLEHPIFQI